MLLKNNTLIKRDEMVTFKITPDFRVSNTKNEIITSAITNIYKAPSSRISLVNINYKVPSRVYFNIVLRDRNAQFYMTMPRQYQDLIEGKMSSCWKNCGIDEVEDNSFLKLKSSTTVGGELLLKDYNFKSISSNLSDSSHLNSIFQLMRSMGKDDEIIINLAIEPMSRNNWFAIAQEETKNEKEGKVKFDIESLQELAMKKVFEGASSLIDLYLEYKLLPVEAILGLIGGESGLDIREGKDKKSMDIEPRGLSRPTSSAKKNSDVAKCKITILSSSPELSRANINLLSVAESFKELNDENEFLLKSISEKNIADMIRKVRNHCIAPKNNCILSTKEMAKLMQLPPQKTQKDYKIKAIDEAEGEVSKELLKGRVPIAITKKRGREQIVYRSEDKSTRCLPWIYIGNQNVGKTTIMKRMALENFKMGDSNLVIDTIQDCKVALGCKEHIPDNMRVDIDVSLSNTKNVPSFSFNEVSNLITEDMDGFARLSLASNIAEQVELIISNVSNDTPLTDAMIRYLYSACLVTFIRPKATMKDVFDVLRIPEERHKAILYAQASGCFDDESVFYNLYQLDKEIKVKEWGYDENGQEKEFTTTQTVNNDQAIVGINNRITQLEKIPYVRKMLSQRPKEDEDFLKYIEEGKTIVVTIPQHDFQSKRVRDTLALYYFSRIWLAVQSRKDNDNAIPCHIFFDEIYTIPATRKLLEEHVTEFRRHRIGLVTSAHHLGQFEEALPSFQAAGGNYMIFSSAEKNTYNLLKENLMPFEYDDILKLKAHHALILQRGQEGYSKYIGRLPDFLEDISHIENYHENKRD